MSRSADRRLCGPRFFPCRRHEPQAPTKLGSAVAVQTGGAKMPARRLPLKNCGKPAAAQNDSALFLSEALG
jgi:hypothetical protein